MSMAPETRALMETLAADMAAGRMIPYLGPEVLTLGPVESPVPTGARELAAKLCSRVAVPGRIRNNLWHTAQYIETFRHRVTVDKLLAETFKPVPEPTHLHRWLASLDRLPMIVDTWYDGTMREALAGRSDWGSVQGASKARRTTDVPWTRHHDATGAEVSPEIATGWATLLYKPHGAAHPDGDVLASDADYVEVLTDIDLQTPIPQAVQLRRTGTGFVFLGCRFYDQILRTFARCIMRRSGGPHYAVMPEDMTANERKFFEVEGITPIIVPLAEAALALTGAPADHQGLVV
ncbi:MAG: SIR2 family protein [Rhodospirillaceae bacterium]|nr:SIR2 family protein [Rhodospirillales bacterium]